RRLPGRGHRRGASLRQARPERVQPVLAAGRRPPGAVLGRPGRRDRTGGARAAAGPVRAGERSARPAVGEGRQDRRRAGRTAGRGPGCGGDRGGRRGRGQRRGGRPAAGAARQRGPPRGAPVRHPLVAGRHGALGRPAGAPAGRGPAVAGPVHRRDRRGPGQLVNTITSRATFSTMMIPVTTEIATVVTRRLTSGPMMSRRRVSKASGTSANGMPKDSTTWEITRLAVVGRPRPSTIRAGAMVIARRR